MQSSYSAKQIADLALPGLPTSERGIQLRAKKEKWQAIKQPCQGGYTINYLTFLLPAEIRLAIATKTAIASIKPQAGSGAQAGATLAAGLMIQQAENNHESQIAKERGLAAYQALAADKKAVADARFDVLQAKNAFLRATRLKVKAGTATFCSHYQAGTIKLPPAVTALIGPSLSWSTINRWQQAYDSQGMIGLAPGYHSPKKGTTTIPEPMREMITGLIVEHLDIGLKRIMDAIAARFPLLDPPSESTVARFVKAYRQEHSGLFEFMKNPDTWRSNRMLAFGSASEHIVRLNQVWEFDSTVGDVMLKDGRHCVIGVIDVYSRRLKLLVSKTSKATAVAALTRNAILDWGVPEVAHTDNGADYVSKHMVRVFDGLGVIQELCDPFQPQQKPHIERAFGTFSHSICTMLPGFVGHSVADRKSIEARKSFAQRMMQGGEPIAIELTAAEFQQVCDRWLTAIYHQDSHGGLNDQTPAQVARAWKEPIRRITNLRALDVLLSEAPGGDGLRTVTKKGIQIDNVWYQAPEFGALINYDRQIKVLLDATDLGTVHCYDTATGNFICVAVDPIRKGINRAEMAAKGRAIQKQVMSDGVKYLKGVAKEAATQGIYQEVMAHREAKIANTLELPKLAISHTSPALDQAARAADAIAGRQQEPIQLTPEEYTKSESILAELERKSGIRLALPGTETEVCDMLIREQEQGLELSDKEERWLLEYDKFLMTGKRVGLLAEGWQPYAERARIAREATGK